MLRNRIIVFIYFLLLSGTYSFGQDYELNHIEKSHGLSNSWITSLFQDSKGMVWIGTMLGLNRYDGHQIKAYTADQTKKNKLRGNYIIGVNEDMYGTLWVSSSEGLALFDPLFNEFEYLQDYSAEIQPGIVSKTLMDGRGQIWFHQKVDGKPALFYLNTSEKLSKKMRSGKLSASDFNINKIQLPPDFGDRMMHIGLQSDNQLLLAGDNGIFYLFNTDNKVFKKVDINNYVIPLNDGTKILKSVNNLNSTIIFSNYTFKETISLSQMAEVLWLPDGRQLLARYYDKNLYDITQEIKTGEKISLSKIQNKIVLKDPQSIARIVDKAGNIWVGTAGNGLYLYKLVEGFKLHAKGSIFYNIEEIKPGHIWQGIFDKSQTLHIPSGKMVAPLWDALLPKNTRVLAAKRSAKSNKLYLMCHEGDQAKMILYEYDLSLNQLKKPILNLHILIFR